MQGGRRAAFSAEFLLITLFFLLPAAVPPLFAWLNCLLAAPVFVLLQVSEDEKRTAGRMRNGLLAAAAAALLLGQPVLFLFSATMLPLGWILHRSAQRGASPAAAGGAGLAVLGLSWLAFWLLLGLAAGENPYSSLLHQLDSSLARLAEAYRASSEIPEELLRDMELITAELRNVLLPKILPGLLAGTAVFTVWLNMVAGSGILRRLRAERAVWHPYRNWRLPDALIWLLIAAAGLALLGGGDALAQAGYTLGIAAGLLYFFQGAAVFASLLHRWSVPTFWRAVLYFFVAVQGYGVLLLTAAGVADTWADFRRLAQEGRPDNGTS